MISTTSVTTLLSFDLMALAVAIHITRQEASFVIKLTYDGT